MRPRFLFPGDLPPDPAVDPPEDGEGLVAIGGSLDVPTVLAAYRRGVFPWSSDPMCTWWSPDPRAIFDLASWTPHRTILRSIKRAGWTSSVDRDFEGVMRGCAESVPGREETWITPDFFATYGALHRAGRAHSVEVWEGDALVGGIYGVALGGFFGGESMFHRATDASKAAVHFLVERLRACGFTLFDAQVMNPHLERLGAVDIPRREYLARLREALPREAALSGAAAPRP